MNIIEKLENYFNSGSTDKQNKRKLGGLLIAITAILLVVATVALSVGGVVALVGGIIDGFDKGDEPVDDGTNSHLVDVDGADIIAAATGTITLDATVPANMNVSKFGEVAYRPKKADGTTPIYKANMPQGLQKEAYDAFNQLITDFHNQSSKDQTFWLESAYDTSEGAVNSGYYANALAVDIWYEFADESTQSGKNYAPIHNSDDFDWIFKNAYKYGFVRVSNADGEESILRYVGVAHAKYIYDKQVRSKDTFYTVDAYYAELKATTPDTKMTNTGVKSIGETSTAKYYVYYTTAAAGQLGKLPAEGYSYSVVATADGGYVVTYFKAPTKK